MLSPWQHRETIMADQDAFNTSSTTEGNMDKAGIGVGEQEGVNPISDQQEEIAPELVSQPGQPSLPIATGQNSPEKEVAFGPEVNENGKTTVIDERIQKPYLGGFRHVLTKKEYHNASAQTNTRISKQSKVERFTRDTQTVTTKQKIQQTNEDTSTQMTKIGCYVSDSGDKVIIPGKYITADQKHKEFIKKVVILQSYWRMWLATQLVQHLRNDRNRRIEWETQEKLRKEHERIHRIKEELTRRLNPKTPQDFDLLYAALEKWRLEEIELIQRAHDKPEQKAALANLLEQESYLISSIEQQKAAANQRNYSQNNQKLLDKAASSKRLRSFDGKITLIDTPNTLHAAKLRDIYNSVNHKGLTREERLDVLDTVTNLLTQENQCQLTQSILELLDREREMTSRNMKEKNLEGLRQRITTLFLRYCKLPQFNPEISRLSKVPNDSSKLRQDIYFCPSCNSYLQSTAFPLQSNSRVIGRCKACVKLENESRLRQDISKFHAMLQTLRQEEQDKGNQEIVFLIQDRDIQHLVEQIWCGQSALSANTDLHELILAKWDRHEQWSPWNCVLLTKDEAAAHTKLDNIHQAYGKIFIAKVHSRQVIAKNYFKTILQLAQKKCKNASNQKSC